MNCVHDAEKFTISKNSNFFYIIVEYLIWYNVYVKP